ncbi:hypothetical protein OF83DRAFT_1156772 [Amylostereum chailletii]|nr:hypothetical protein OF83DRAFT_1156772 [Amylostereum chailletii]
MLEPPDEATLGPKARRDHWLHEVRLALEAWREETWDQLYSRRRWGSEALMVPTILTAFASHARWRTVEDVRKADSMASSWLWLDTHGEEVLERIRSIDVRVLDKREAKKRKAVDTRKEETARRNAEKARRKEEDRRRKAETLQRAREGERSEESIRNNAGAPAAATSEGIESQAHLQATPPWPRPRPRPRPRPVPRRQQVASAPQTLAEDVATPSAMTPLTHMQPPGLPFLNKAIRTHIECAPTALGRSQPTPPPRTPSSISESPYELSPFGPSPFATSPFAPSSFDSPFAPSYYDHSSFVTSVRSIPTSNALRGGQPFHGSGGHHSSSTLRFPPAFSSGHTPASPTPSTPRFRIPVRRPGSSTEGGFIGAVPSTSFTHAYDTPWHDTQL